MFDFIRNEPEPGAEVKCCSLIIYSHRRSAPERPAAVPYEYERAIRLRRNAESLANYRAWSEVDPGGGATCPAGKFEGPVVLVCRVDRSSNRPLMHQSSLISF
jgi:hypothetical protein